MGIVYWSDGNMPIYNGKIPENAPQKVKEILDRRCCCGEGWSETKGHYCFATPDAVVEARIKMAKDISALGYNPLDYGLNLEDLNKILSDIAAGKEYRTTLYDSATRRIVTVSQLPRTEIKSKSSTLLKKVANSFRKLLGK